MELTDDTFRALARSSPWRWHTLHFTRTDTSRQGAVDVREAWYRRPDALRVRRGEEVETQRQPAERTEVPWSTEPVMRAEEADNGGFVPKDPRHYPDAFDVALDVETGVMVLVVPVGGSDLYEAWDIEIHEVDSDLTGSLG